MFERVQKLLSKKSVGQMVKGSLFAVGLWAALAAPQTFAQGPYGYDYGPRAAGQISEGINQQFIQRQRELDRYRRDVNRGDVAPWQRNQLNRQIDQLVEQNALGRVSALRGVNTSRQAGYFASPVNGLGYNAGYGSGYSVGYGGGGYGGGYGAGYVGNPGYVSPQFAAPYGNAGCHGGPVLGGANYGNQGYGNPGYGVPAAPGYGAPAGGFGYGNPVGGPNFYTTPYRQTGLSVTGPRGGSFNIAF